MNRAVIFSLICMLSACSSFKTSNADYSECDFVRIHYACTKNIDLAMQQFHEAHQQSGADTLLFGAEFEKYKATEKYKEAMAQIEKIKKESSLEMCNLPIPCLDTEYHAVSLRCAK